MTDLERLNRDLAAYQIATGKGIEQTLAKQGAKLGFHLKLEFRRLEPGKGQIRAQALARLKSGEGIKVRPSVRKKVFAKAGAASRLSDRRTVYGATLRGTRGGKNLAAAAVQAEINLREKGRGFIGYSVPAPAYFSSLKAERTRSRYGPTLAQAGLRLTTESKVLRYEWGPFSEMSAGAAAGIATPRGDAAVSRAIRDTANDIEAYLDRKLAEAWRATMK